MNEYSSCAPSGAISSYTSFRKVSAERREKGKISMLIPLIASDYDPFRVQISFN